MYFKNHLYFISLSPGNITDDQAKIKDLRHFIREERELDLLVEQKFPLTLFENLDDDLLIKGSKDLIEAFNRIDAEKLDIQEKLKNIEFVGFTDKGESILNFKEDGIQASGIYDFSFDFFEDIFSMGKFAGFCLENNYQDLIKSDIEELIEKMPDVERQYRLLMVEDVMLLRGHTSSRYNDYDNNLALYLGILSLHKFAKENDLYFYVSSAYLTDSEIRVFFRQENPIHLNKIGDVYFGAVLRNSEIRDSMLTFEMRYELVDVKRPDKSFAGIPDLKDAVFNISHSTRVNSLENRLERIFNLKELQESMLVYISELSKLDKFSSDAAFRLLNLITFSRNLSKATKQNFRQLYDKYLISNTLTLIEAFDLAGTITTDIDEKTHLERLYHQLIMQLTK